MGGRYVDATQKHTFRIIAWAIDFSIAAIYNKLYQQCDKLKQPTHSCEQCSFFLSSGIKSTVLHFSTIADLFHFLTFLSMSQRNVKWVALVYHYADEPYYK